MEVMSDDDQTARGYQRKGQEVRYEGGASQLIYLSVGLQPYPLSAREPPCFKRYLHARLLCFVVNK